MKPIEFDVLLLEEDYITFQFLDFYKVRLVGKATIGIGIASIIIALFNVINFGFYEIRTSIASLLLGIVILLGYPYQMRKRAVASYAEDDLIKKNQHYAISESGVTVSSESEDQIISWSEIHKVYEHKKCLLIYRTKAIAYVIPKRYLDNEYLNLNLILRSSLPKEKLKRIR